MTARPRALDQDARDRVVYDLDHNMLVEAGAGTGKTTVLVGRIVETLAQGKADIDSIAVITFTEKAAAELSTRVREGLEKAMRDPARDADQQQRIAAALEGVYRARIETIHAFATSLLRERPVESPVDPQFQVLDEVAGDLLFDEVYNAWLDDQLTGDNQLLTLALNRGFDLAHLRQAAEVLHTYREALPLKTPPTPHPDVHAFVAFATAQMADLKPLLDTCVDPDADRGYEQALNLADFLDRCTEAGDDTRELERIVLRGPGLKKAGNKGNWDPGENKDAAAAIVVEVGQALAEIKTDLRAEALAGMLPALEDFVAAYAERRRAEGRADFDDLLIWARDLLRENAEVRDYFRAHYDRIFVDEFQDTDPLQAELAVLLMGHATDGKLFVVGDPKQSIYRFRRADIAIYDQVKNGPLAGCEEQIQQNFRSLAGVLDFTNRVFGDLFGDGKPGVQARQVDLLPGPAQLELGRSPVVVVHGDGEATKAEDVRIAEAQAIARTIYRAVELDGWQVRDRRTDEVRSAGWGDVAVLMPTRTSLEALEDALSEFGIPYRAEGGRSFFDRAEVRQLAAILNALDDPTDQIAVVAALRSNAFGCSDEEVFLYVAAGGRLDYRFQSADEPECVVEALKTLGNLHRQRRGLSLPELVRRVLDDTGLVEFALARRGGTQAAANLLKLVDQSRAFTASGGGGLRAFTTWLDRHREADEYESEASVTDEADGVVRLLTIHMAKGLEFPIVALANLNGKRKTQRQPVVQPERNQVHFEVGSAKLGKFATRGYDQALQEEQGLLEEERKRLLYVGLTRARDHLVIPAIPPREKRAGMLQWIGDHLPAYSDDVAGTDVGGCFVYPRPDLEAATPPEPPRELEVDDDAVEAAELALADWEEQRRGARRMASEGLVLTTASNVKPYDRVRPLAAMGQGDGELVELAAAPPLPLGSALHTTMEKISLPDGEDLERVARAACADAGVSEFTPLVVQMARTCLASRAVRAAIASGKWYREIPFTVVAGTAGYAAGRMDLVYRDGDGVVIVDYKSDNISADAVSEAMEHHRAQAAVYAAATTTATRLAVKEIRFVFARNGEEAVVEVDDALLEEGRLLCEQGVALPPEAA